MCSKVNSSISDVSSQCATPVPHLPEILDTLKALVDKYVELGLHLNVGYDRLKEIEGEHEGNLRRFIEMITSWQNNSANCSWSTLADAIEKIGGYNNLVKKLRARTSSPDNSTCHQPHCHGGVGSSEDTGYSSKGTSATSGDSSGSEVEHFDEVPGCGCDKPCSIYTLCARGCPRPTNTKVGVVKKRAHDQALQAELLPEEEAEVEDYAEKFEKDTRRMRTQFAAFVSDICCSFKKKDVTTDALTLYLQNASPLTLKPRINEMNKATSLEQVLKIVTSQVCSWFDYEVMKDLISYFGDEQDKMLLDEYEANFRKFAEQRLPKGKKHIEVSSGTRRGGAQLIIKMDKEWNEVTFHDIKKVRGNLASILGVHRKELYLADVREGCLMMTFIVPEELVRGLFPIKNCLTSSQVQSLEDESIILFKCGKLSWRSLLVDSLRYQELSENLTSICTEMRHQCLMPTNCNSDTCWTDSHIDDLPAIESPESSQPKPNEPEHEKQPASPKPFEPYILLENHKENVISSTSHQQPVNSRCAPADDDTAKKDSHYSDSSKFDDHDYENYKHRAPATSTQQMQLSDSPTFRAGQALSSTTPGDVSPPDDSSYNYIQPSNSSNVSTAVPISQLTTIQKSPQLDSRFRRSSLPSPELRSNDAIQRTKSIELQDLVSKKSLQNEKDKEAEIISSVKSAAALACEEVPKSSIDSSSPSSDKVIPPVLASKSIGMSQSVEIRGVIVASVRSADVSSVLSQGNIGDHSKSRLDHIPQQPHQWRVLPPRRGQVGPHPSYAVALPPRNIPRRLYPPGLKQAWHLPPAMQPLMQQAVHFRMDPSFCKNTADPSLSPPVSFGHHLREGLERRSNERGMLAIKPTTETLPPRNIPRRSQY